VRIRWSRRPLTPARGVARPDGSCRPMDVYGKRLRYSLLLGPARIGVSHSRPQGLENASGALCSFALPGSAFPTAPTGPAASLYIFLNLKKRQPSATTLAEAGHEGGHAQGQPWPPSQAWPPSQVGAGFKRRESSGTALYWVRRSGPLALLEAGGEALEDGTATKVVHGAMNQGQLLRQAHAAPAPSSAAGPGPPPRRHHEAG
jgi:hypothetical protein